MPAISYVQRWRNLIARGSDKNGITLSVSKMSKQATYSTSSVSVLTEAFMLWRLRLAGRVLRQAKVRPANVAMNWTLDDRKRSRGRPEQTWRQTFGEDLQGMGVTWREAKRVASDRQRWRNLVAQCSDKNGTTLSLSE